MKILFVSIILFSCAASAQTTYTLNSSCDTNGECNWNDGSSWVGGVAPTGGTPANGDIIVIPAGTYIEIEGNPNNTNITNAVIIKIYGTVDIQANNARLILANAAALIQIDQDASLLGGGNSARLSIGGVSIKGPVVDALVAPNELSVDNIDGGGCAVVADCSDDDPLPVELVSFDAVPSSGKTVLNWQTASEKNNDYFSVERSENGSDFYEIGIVEGNGTTDVAQNYTFSDGAPIANIEYYRLRQVDFDGQFEIHKIIVAYSDKFSTTVSMEVYPNPASDRISLKTIQPVVYTYIKLVNISGKVVSEFNTSTNGLKLEAELPPLKSGLYYIKYQTSTGVSGSKKLMIR